MCLLGVQVPVEGKGWMDLAIDNYGYCWRAFRRGLACPCNKTNSSGLLVVYSLVAPNFTILSSIWLSFSL